MRTFEEAMKELDESMALLLVEPSSGTALSFLRTLDILRIKMDDPELMMHVEVLHEDALELQDIVLTLETDPEMVKRNMMARVISGVFPVLNTMEEFRSFEDKGFFDMVTSSLGVIAEVTTATQYLEASKLASQAHLERHLVKVEARFVELAMDSGSDLEKKVERVHDFIDRLRDLELSSSQKHFVPFLLWLVIIVLSYKKLKR